MRQIAVFLLSLPGLLSAAASLEVAQQLFDSQAYALAAEEFRATLHQAPSQREAARARFALAESLRRLGAAERAALAYDDFIERHSTDPAVPEALLGSAQVRLGSRDYAGARSMAEEFLHLYPSHPLAWQAAFFQGEALYGAGSYQEAELAYKSVGERYPAFPRPEYLPYARAWCLYQLGQLPGRDAQAGTLAQDSLRQAAALFAVAHDMRPGSALAPGALYQQGESLYQLKDFDAASAAYRSLEKGHGDHALAPAARYSIAWCYFDKGKWKDASTAFHRFSVLHPDHELAPWAMYLAGVSLARAKDYDLAQSAYELTLKNFPSSAVVDKARYGLAWLATVRRDYVAATAEYERFLKAHPASPLAASAVFLLADALYHQGRFASAREQYQRLLKDWASDPLAEDALYYAANCSLAAGEYAQARDDLRQFLRSRPESQYAPDAALRLADALFGLGDLAQAEKEYLALSKRPAAKREGVEGGAALGLAWVAYAGRDWGLAARRFAAAASALGGGPKEAEAWLRSGDARFNLADYNAALEAYGKAVRVGAGTALEGEALFQSAWAAYRLKNFSHALARWQSASKTLKDEGRRGEAAYWMGWTYFRRELWAEAAEAFGRMAEEHAQSHLVPEALLHRGDSLQNGSRCDEAILQYQAVVERFPRHKSAASALHGIQLCYYALGKEEEAVTASKAFLKENQDPEIAPEVQYHVAEHYLNRSDFAKAEAELNTLKSSFPGSKLDLSATYWRGQARFKNLKFNEAIQDWKELVKRAPGHALAPRALFKVGLAYYRLQEYPQAVALFNQVLDAYGNTLDVAADARFNLGMTYKRMHRDDEAAAAYDAVVRDYPHSELAGMARIRIGYLFEDNGQHEKAAEAYRALAGSDPGKLGAEAQYLVGDCMLALKKSGEALLAYDAVAANFPAEQSWVVTAQAKAGELLETLGRDKEALERYERIVALGSDPTWVASAGKRIEIVRARLGVPAEAKPAPGKASTVKKKAPKAKAAEVAP